MTQHVYGSGPCVTMLGYDTVQVRRDALLQQLEEALIGGSHPARWVPNLSLSSSRSGSNLAMCLPLW